MRHIPVLLQETLDGLKLRRGDSVLDATSGSGGHGEALLSHIGRSGTLICLDQDEDALARSRLQLDPLPGTKKFVRGNFRDLAQLLSTEGITEIDAALFDLGMSSEQLEESGRGFSFLKDEPLLMTMQKGAALSAKDLLATLSESQLVDILKSYGEEQFAQKIAHGIVTARKENPIESTTALVRIIKESTPPWYSKRRIHPATKSFQALRIAVNDEYSAIDEGLESAFTLLKPGGNIAVISFHGGEVRHVKSFFRHFKERSLTRVNKHAIKPSRTEMRENPRARSAQLFIFKKAI